MLPSKGSVFCGETVRILYRGVSVTHTLYQELKSKESKNKREEKKGLKNKKQQKKELNDIAS